MRTVWLLLLLVACGDGGSGSGADAGIDARPDARPMQPTMPPYCHTLSYIVHASCGGGQATTTSEYGGAGRPCTVAISNVKATCTQGCAVDTSLREFAPTSNQGALRSSIPKFLFAPRVLCAETPQAAVGDSCKLNGTMPCLPTRAQLAADGTVTGQTYLVCGADEKCAAAPAPVIPQYLEPCAPSYITQYGHPGVNAFATTGSGACLLAWNTATQAVATGRTTKCVGDWDCPAGSLCDDQVVSVHFNDFSAVCKPGPRGVLTPAMLAP